MRVVFALLFVVLGVALCVFERALAPLWMGVTGLLAVLVAIDRAPVAMPVTQGNDVVPAAPPAAPPSIELRVIEALNEPILLVEANRVATANAAARALLGEHIVGENVRLAIRHPVAAEQFGRADPTGVVELVGLDGGAQRMRMEVVALDPGQRLVHLSDRSTSHAAERARVDFVANASHELRTPLAAILGFVETLSDDHAGGDAAVRGRFLAVTMKEARRMQRLIDDLISLSRIEAERYAPLATRVSLEAIARQVVAEQRDAGGGPRAEITLEIVGDLPDILGEPAHLSQVIHNLLDNAFRYGRPPVVVRLTEERRTLRLSVADQGDGIAAEHVPRLTERFYRVDPSRSRSVGGTGLGLAIVKHIVERHRGRLDIVSRAGAGTTVTVAFPVAQPLVVMPPIAPAPAALAPDNAPAVIKPSSN